MLFLLDIILVVNLFLAYKFFKNFFAPAYLMGLGMLIASIVATLHYEAWSMSDFSFVSVLILGGCPFFFTICCKLFSTIFKKNNFTQKHTIHLEKVNWYALEKFYIVSLFVFFVHTIYIYISMKNFFQSSTLSELMYARRLDFNSDETLFELPFLSRQLSFIFNILSMTSVWLFFIIRIFFSKLTKQHVRILYYVAILIIFRSIEGLLTGARGNVLPILFWFIFFYIQLYYSSIGKFSISKKIYKRLIIVFVVIGLSFSSFSLFMGRNVEHIDNNYEMLSEYCGAQIKNFDILLKRNFESTGGFGAHTFDGIYKRLFHIDVDLSSDMRRFESVNGHILGNVYTQFANYYVDFGVFGSFVIILLMALITTFIYNKSQILLYNPIAISACVIVYCWIMFYIFLCFFAGQFTSTLISPLGIKYGIVSSLFLFFFKKILYAPKT